MEKTAIHQCLPIPSQICQTCGEALPSPAFCECCGEDVSPAHVCLPRPLPHYCASKPTSTRCLICGEELPQAHFCPTCGERLEAIHHCAQAATPQVRRADPVHVCRALSLQYCGKCGGLMPALKFCETCGMDISLQHACPPQTEPHVCAPYLMIPRSCPRCGETMPTLQHCPHCGKNVTPEHVCRKA